MADIESIDFTKPDVVEVRLGEQSYFAHIGILTKSSVFFQKALEGPFREASEKRVELHDVKPEIFLVYLRWLHGGNMSKLTRVHDIVHDHDYRDKIYKDPEMTTTPYSTLIRLGVLADQIQDVALHNRVVDLIIFTIHKTGYSGYPCNMVRYVYDHTPSSSPVRRIMVHIAAEFSSGLWKHFYFSTNCNDYREGPLEFWRDLAMALVENEAPFVVGRMKVVEVRAMFHLHNDEQPLSECHSCSPE